MSSRGSVFIVSAPSGAGKTSLVKRLIEDVANIQVAVSHTTRPKRNGDVDGRDYHFTDRDAFERMIADDAFIEHADVFGNYYGTSQMAVDACLSSGADVILEIDWQGAAQVRERIDGTRSIFIIPPSREILLQRLRGRGTDSDEVIELRTQAAVNEMRHLDTADYLLINDDFEQTLAQFKSVISATRLATARQVANHQSLVDELLS